MLFLIIQKTIAKLIEKKNYLKKEKHMVDKFHKNVKNKLIKNTNKLLHKSPDFLISNKILISKVFLIISDIKNFSKKQCFEFFLNWSKLF